MFLLIIEGKRPQSIKGQFLDKIYMTTTMGPSFKIKTQSLDPKDKQYSIKIWIFIVKLFKLTYFTEFSSNFDMETNPIDSNLVLSYEMSFY